MDSVAVRSPMSCVQDVSLPLRAEALSCSIESFQAELLTGCASTSPDTQLLPAQLVKGLDEVQFRLSRDSTAFVNSQVPLAAEALFGPGLRAREAFAWQVPQQILFVSWRCLTFFVLSFVWTRKDTSEAKLRTRLKSFRRASDSERSKRNAPGALVPWPLTP